MAALDQGTSGSGTPEAAASSAEPWGVAREVTPNGLEIYYQAGPKRLYRVRERWVPASRGAGDVPGEWIEVPSISTVTGVLFKPLENWGMKVGVRGVLKVMHSNPEMWIELVETHTDEELPDAVVALMKEHQLTVYYETKKAQNRGTSVHKALEMWAEDKTMPDPQFFPEEERGYVAGLVAFINDAHPHTLASELMVGSAEHGFAGRFDLLANLDFSGEVVTRLYPKRKPKREQLSGVWLIDAKTSSGVWGSYKIQLGGYEQGMEDSGHPLPDHKGVLRLTSDGQYELVESKATGADFLAVLGCYRAMQGL